MNRKLKRQAEHLKFMVRAEKNWPYLTEHSDGIFFGKVKLVTFGGEFLFTRPQLQEHIQITKANIKKTLTKRK